MVPLLSRGMRDHCLAGGVKTGVIVDEVHAIMLPKMFEEMPVKTANAQTRRKKDKDMIDAFIQESVGFEAALDLTQSPTNLAPSRTTSHHLA